MTNLTSGSIISLEPNQILLGSGTSQWSQTSQHQNVFYFPDFFLQNQSLYRTHSIYQTYTHQQFIPELQKKNYHPIEWEPLDRSEFNQAFVDVQKKFASGELQKAVLYVMATGRGKIAVPNVLESMMQFGLNRPVFLYGYWDQDEGMLGVSPEILMNIQEGKLSTMACAGTCRNDQDLSEFLNNPKERNEHQLVIDGIQESLSPFGTVQLGDLRAVSFSHLSHLITPIEVNLEGDYQLDPLVQALHPTPALGAYPKKQGTGWLRKYDKMIPRCRYGAPVGVIRDGGKQVQMYVGIRNIQWKGDEVRIGVGCGIVAESNMDQEWEEIQAKLHMTKEMLGL